MKDKKVDVNVNTGALFFELMFLMFLGLKISGLIDWSWIWVFAPLWVPAVVVLVILGIMGVFLIATRKKVVKK